MYICIYVYIYIYIYTYIFSLLCPALRAVQHRFVVLLSAVIRTTLLPSVPLHFRSALFCAVLNCAVLTGGNTIFHLLY